MSDGWNIALLGATGATGSALLDLLAERQFPVGELFLLASEHSAGESVRFKGKTLKVTQAAEFDWTQAQLAFFVAGPEASERYAEQATNAGCLVIDSSGQFSLDPDVPLVVPEVNPQVLEEYRNRNIVSVADSLTCQLLSVIKPLADQAGAGRLQIVNLLSVATSGKAAIDALAGESASLLSGIPVDQYYFGRQLAFNLLSKPIDQQGSVTSERRLVEQVRKVMQDDGLPVAVTSIQAPSFYINSQIVHFEALRPLAAEEAEHILGTISDLMLESAETQDTETEHNRYISISGLRNDYGMAEVLQFHSTADHIHFGGAMMAIKTAEKLVQEYFW